MGAMTEDVVNASVKTTDFVEILSTPIASRSLYQNRDHDGIIVNRGVSPLTPTVAIWVQL